MHLQSRSKKIFTPKVMAASAVIVVPLLIMFAFTQKWFINGIGGDTGVKG